MRIPPHPLLVCVFLSALTASAVACGGPRNKQAVGAERPTHSVTEVARVLESHDFRLRPLPLRLARVVVPAAVRTREPGRHILGFVEADDRSLVKSLKSGYMIMATVFDSPDAADGALAIEPDWIGPGSGSLHTAQFQQDNVVVVIGARPTEERIAELRAALDELASG